MRLILVCRVYRTGVQTVEYDPDAEQHFVTIKNRTYRSEHPVPLATALRWLDHMNANGPERGRSTQYT